MLSVQENTFLSYVSYVSATIQCIGQANEHMIPHLLLRAVRANVETKIDVNWPWEWRCTPAVTALKRPRPENHELRVVGAAE